MLTLVSILGSSELVSRLKVYMNECSMVGINFPHDRSFPSLAGCHIESLPFEILWATLVGVGIKIEKMIRGFLLEGCNEEERSFG